MGKGMGGVYPMDLNGFDLLLGGKYCSHCLLFSVFFTAISHITYIIDVFLSHSNNDIEGCPATELILPATDKDSISCHRF